ncbi:MAG TPA: hypothetical protein VG293_05310 [Solirubrobacteraceae bacterium]|nr:hypothetical protein [Solirubrobacteraceae bacterium]
MSNDDLNWPAARRPSRSGTDRDAHDRALVLLLRQATASPPPRRERLGFTGLFNSRVLAVATGTGVAAIAAAVFLSANSGTKPPATSRGGGAHVPQAVVAHHSTRSSLIRLGDDLSTPTATGDATLI